MKTVLWVLLVSAMFFFGCGDDTTLPESEMGTPATKEKASNGTSGSSPRPPSNRPQEPEGPEEPQFPPGEPVEDLAERDGTYFLADGENPFTGAVEKRHRNGRLALWASYSEGKPDGAQHFWDEKGNKVQESNYTKGSLDGIQTFWWPNGIKKEERIWQAGEYRELRRWSRDGELVEENRNF